MVAISGFEGVRAACSPVACAVAGRMSFRRRSNPGGNAYTTFAFRPLRFHKV